MNSASVREYVQRARVVENEISLLREDRKELDKEFKEKLDVKAIKAALRIAKLRSQNDQGSVDLVLDILGDAVSDSEV